MTAGDTNKRKALEIEGYQMANDKKNKTNEEKTELNKNYGPLAPVDGVTVSRAQFEKLRAIEAQEKAVEHAVAASELRQMVLKSVFSGAPLKEALALMNECNSDLLDIAQEIKQDVKAPRAFANRVRFTDSEVKGHFDTISRMVGTFSNKQAETALNLNKSRAYQILSKAIKAGIVENVAATGHPVYKVKSTSAPTVQPAN